jgi:hypothetical protein
VLELEPFNVESAAAAFRRQALTESTLTRDAERMMTAFLSRVRQYAYSGRVYPPQVQLAWEDAVEDMFHGITVQETRDYLGPIFFEADLPADVYSTAQILLSSAATSFASEAERRDAIDRALGTDGFALEQLAPSMQASMLSLTAAGFWDGLEKTGNVWIKRIRNIVRTGATGLQGWTTITVMRLQDYEMKRWVTRHDARVRASHRVLDGVTIPLSEKFDVGGFQLAYPGDRDAELGEIVNCRCVLTGVNKRKGR